MMTETVTQEGVIRDAKLVGELLAGMLYDDTTYYEAIMEDLKDTNDLGYTLTHISLQVLEGLKARFKRPMYHELLYIAGTLVLRQINGDLKSMGHKSLDEKALAKVTRDMMMIYIRKHQSELDMKAIGASLKMLQTAIVDGTLNKRLAAATKIGHQKLSSEVNKVVQPGIGVVPKAAKAGVLAR
jgi:hypothetical protein